jgi:hypothetical protein
MLIELESASTNLEFIAVNERHEGIAVRELWTKHTSEIDFLAAWNTNGVNETENFF